MDDKTGNEQLAKLTDGENAKSAEQDSEVAALNSPDGIEVHLTPEQTEYCLQDYSQIALKDSNKARAMAHWIKKDRLSQPFQAEGVLEALLNGPAPTGQDNEGYATYLRDNKGSYVYQNEVTGQYFIANPANLRDPNTLQVVDNLSSLTAEGSPFTPTHLLKVRSNVSPNVAKGREYWGTWEDYPKVDSSYNKQLNDGTYKEVTQEYAVIGGRLYSRHVVAHMRPSGLRFNTELAEGRLTKSEQLDYDKKLREQEKLRPKLLKELEGYLIYRLERKEINLDKMSAKERDEALNKELGRVMKEVPNIHGFHTFDGKAMTAGRSISPTDINSVVRKGELEIDESGNKIYTSERLRVIESPKGTIITVVKKKSEGK